MKPFRTVEALGRQWVAARLLSQRLSGPERLELAAALARRTLDALDVRLAVHGAGSIPDAPVLIVANHVSWLDVYALNALRPARFVAKSETASWPIAGGITRGFDSIFIVRQSIRDAYRVKECVAAALASGSPVAVFPEATTTDGKGVLRFHPAMFQAAIDVDVPVQPVAIRYLDQGGAPSTAPAFVGDMTFADSLLRVLRADRLTVELTAGPVLSPSRVCRRQLAAAAHDFVRRVLGSPPRVGPRVARASAGPRPWPGAPRGLDLSLAG